MSSGNTGMVSMKLTDQVVRSFHIGKTFDEKPSKINSIDFSANGNRLVSCNQEEKIIIYDCDSGRQSHVVNSHRYGVGVVRFTLDENCIIYSSTKGDDAVRFLELKTNTYLHYFRGHESKVTSLAVSPKKDGHQFLSGSIDGTVRLWDLRMRNCVGVMKAPDNPIAAFDPEGIIFAAGISSGSIKLYDSRSFSKGPFATHHPIRESDCEWTGMKFANDGKKVLITTNGRMIRLVDAFEGKLLHTFTGPSNNEKLPIEATFSPDSQYIFSGSSDGHVHAWNVRTGNKVCNIDGGQREPIECIQFNPKYMMLASASTKLSFWLPYPENIPQ